VFQYNVCFLKSDDRILMLNREKPPIMGVWNGVGGKIETIDSELIDSNKALAMENELVLKYMSMYAW
jgi:ADP-ribose pyrophosphatase YjhB (NUDIX family)